LPSFAGGGVWSEDECNSAACRFMAEAAWVRQLPFAMSKFRVMTVCSQKMHLNVMVPFTRLVV
jgi:hypothetical protein